MARVQQGVRFAGGTHATADKITDGARWQFLKVLSQTAPTVLGDHADDEVLEELFDRVNTGIFYPDSPKALDYGVKRWQQLKGETVGPRAELRSYLFDWFNDYGLHVSWEWMLDALISTLWRWREAKWRGRTLSADCKLIWIPYNGYYLIPMDETTHINFSHQFENGLRPVDKKVLYKEAKTAFDKVFEDWFATYVHGLLEGDGEYVKTEQQKTLLQFEWLALWQFAPTDYNIKALKAYTGEEGRTIYAGLDAACKKLKVERRSDPRGRPLGK